APQRLTGESIAFPGRPGQALAYVAHGGRISGNECLCEPDLQQPVDQRSYARATGNTGTLNPHLSRLLDVTRRRIDEHQAVHARRVGCCKMLGNEPAQGNACDVRASNPFALENAGKLRGELLDAIGTCGNGAFAMSGKIIAHQREALLETGTGDGPQAVVDAEAMEHHQRRARSRAMNPDRGNVEASGRGFPHLSLLSAYGLPTPVFPAHSAPRSHPWPHRPQALATSPGHKPWPHPPTPRGQLPPANAPWPHPLTASLGHVLWPRPLENP